MNNNKPSLSTADKISTLDYQAIKKIALNQNDSGGQFSVSEYKKDYKEGYHDGYIKAMQDF